MIEASEIAHVVDKLLADHFDIERGIPTSHGLIDDLRADSLDMIELTTAVEEEFDIEITENEAEQVRLVGDIGALVERKLHLDA